MADNNECKQNDMVAVLSIWLASAFGCPASSGVEGVPTHVMLPKTFVDNVCNKKCDCTLLHYTRCWRSLSANVVHSQLQKLKKTHGPQQ